MVVVAAGIRPNIDLAVTSGFTVERAIVVDDQMRTVDDPDVYAVGECVQHRGEVYGLVAPLWEQAVVLADHDHRRRPGRRLPRLADRDQAQGGRRRRRLDGGAASRSGTPTSTSSSPSRSKGVYKSLVIRDDKLIGATMLGDSSQGRLPACRPSTAGCRCPRSGWRCCSTSALPREEVGVAELADDAQVCNCNGVSKGALVGTAWRAAARPSPAVMDKTRAGKGCGSCKSMVCQIVEWAAGGAVEEDPSANYYVPGIPMDKPALMAAIREQGLRSVSAVFAALAPDGRRGREVQDGAGLAAEDDVGRRVHRREGRPVHQRPGARQHPEGRHLLGRPADEGRRHHSRRSCAGSPTSPRSTTCRWSS